MDIKETKEAIKFGMAVGAGVFQSLKDDGKITLADASNFFGAVLELPTAIMGANQIPAELSDLSDSELVEIRDMVLSSLPGIGDKWLQVAKGALSIAGGALTVYSAFSPG
jgi:hypothetical protein